MEKVETLVIGATFFGCAYALKAKEKTLIVESESVLGSDFVACMNASRTDVAGTHTPETKEFLQDMMKRSAVSEDGRIHVYAMSTALAVKLKEAARDILLETHVISVEKEADGYRVRLFNRDGFSDIVADRVIDTRVPAGANLTTGRKYICGMLVGKGELSEFSGETASLLHGALDGEYIFCVPVDMQADWTQARRIFHETYAASRDRLPGYVVASVGSSFAYRFDTPLSYEENGVLHAVSASYRDLFAAFDGGIACASAH